MDAPDDMIEAEIGDGTISRADAVRLGRSRYFTGRPCKHSHIAERSIFNGVCVACKAAADRRRHRLTGLIDATID